VLHGSKVKWHQGHHLYGGKTYVKTAASSHHAEPHVQGCKCLFARPSLAENKENTLDIPVNIKHLLKGQDEVFPHT